MYPQELFPNRPAFTAHPFPVKLKVEIGISILFTRFIKAVVELPTLLELAKE
jgi:hypothetical protein